MASFLLLHVIYFTDINGLPVSLCVKSVGNQHIFLKRNVIDLHKNFMTFRQFLILHDFPRPGFYFFHFLFFSMTVGV